MPTDQEAAHAGASGGRFARADVVRYLLYLVVTSTIVFLIGFVTTALGALVMVFALAGFGAVSFARARGRAGIGPSDRIDTEGVFRWQEVSTTVLACLPAVVLPAELNSPMASTVFFLLFAVPTYCVALGNRAMHVRDQKRVGSGLTFGPLAAVDPLPAGPGWYADPIDPQLVRWRDGWGWTPHWAGPWHAGSGPE